VNKNDPLTNQTNNLIAYRIRLRQIHAYEAHINRRKSTTPIQKYKATPVTPTTPTTPTRLRWETIKKLARLKAPKKRTIHPTLPMFVLGALGEEEKEVVQELVEPVTLETVSLEPITLKLVEPVPAVEPITLKPVILEPVTLEYVPAVELIPAVEHGAQRVKEPVTLKHIPAMEHGAQRGKFVENLCITLYCRVKEPVAIEPIPAVEHGVQRVMDPAVAKKKMLGGRCFSWQRRRKKKE